MLSESQKASASKLAGAAKVGRLSIFIGAGISIPSGAPSWGGGYWKRLPSRRT
jgi:hypothetical protein